MHKFLHFTRFTFFVCPTLTGTGLTCWSIFPSCKSQSNASLRFPTTPHLVKGLVSNLSRNTHEIIFTEKKRYWHLPPPCQRFVAQLNNSNLIRKILTPSPHIKMSHFPSIAFKHLSIKTREADSSEEVFIGPSVFLSQMSSERVKESVGLVTFRIKATKRGLANFKHLPPTLETKCLLQLFPNTIERLPPNV